MLTWNVEGLLGKLGNKDFINFIKEHDIICLTETFLKYSSKLDCFSEFLQFSKPAIKISHQGRHSGGVLVLVKKHLENLVELIDFNEDNMVWLKLDKKMFSVEKNILMCGAYVCPMGSPYYTEINNSVVSAISIIEECILKCIQKFTDVYFLLCGDFNSRTSNTNTAFDELDGDVDSFVQSDVSQFRISEDSTFNSYGRMLLELCFAFKLKLLNGSRPSDKNGNYTYICSNGCSVIDYFIISHEIESKVIDLCITERFESKHMPVVITVGQPLSVPENKSCVIEKLIWNDDFKSVFEAEIQGSEFQHVISNAAARLPHSIDDAISCLSNGLVNAAECMKRKIYTGPKQSAWYDKECTELKRLTRKAWRKFKRSNMAAYKDVCRKEYVECRKKYRQMLDDKSKQYKERKRIMLIKYAKDSKQFWKEVKSLNSKQNVQPAISKEAWANHFKAVLGHTGNTNNHTLVANDEPTPFSVEELDKPITQSEIIEAIHNLKGNKAAGMDGITSEMLKLSLPMCLPFLISLFNHILDSGNYPKMWTNAIIVPIHKSGDKEIPNNYRGVSLLSVLGKVFARILNKRLSVWAEVNNHFVEEQGGFRAGYSTMDNMFVLFGIVQRYLTKRSGKIYVCFVDFQKAFDTINRSLLWNTLKRVGVGGKMLAVLQSMYRTVTSCVRCSEGLTDCFECPNGVRQGCVLSPTLFSFFINELAGEIREKGQYGIQLTPSVIQILVLLFADDVILSSYCPRGLQCQINILRGFAEKSGMTVNLTKTKIIVFRKGGFLGQNEKWWYGREEIEVVNSYKYLGLHFTTKLSLSKAISELAAKAKARTVQILKCLWRLGHVDREVFFHIFDAQVLPVIMYGSEIWGYQQFDVIEKTHMYACKKVLNVGLQTPNKMVLGDLGRFPVYIQTAVRCVKFWLRIISLPEDRLPRKVYNMMCHLQEQGKKVWSSHVKEMLFTNGFGYAWQQQGVGDVDMFLSDFKKRLQDQYRQTWSSDITEKERYEFYSAFKIEHFCEKYISYKQNKCYRDCYVQFRFGVSPLQSHRLRYKKDFRPSQLLCPLCKQEIETERHVLLNCAFYNDLRERVQILNVDGIRAENSEVRIMSAYDEATVLQLSKYLYDVFKRRQQLMAN